MKAKWARAIAYLRLSTSYRRILLNDWLYRWRDQIHGLVLDIGGERYSLASYQGMSTTDSQKWLYLNIRPDVAPNIVADGAHIPLAAETIDTVVCLETLEHVDNPLQIVQESARVLRPAGALLLSAPFLYRIHAAPNDFWRFTEYQLQRIVQEAGLEIVRMERLGLFLTVLCDMTKQVISEIRVSILRWLVGLLFLPLAALLIMIDQKMTHKRFHSLTTFTTGYLVLAIKNEHSKMPDRTPSVEDT